MPPLVWSRLTAKSNIPAPANVAPAVLGSVNTEIKKSLDDALHISLLDILTGGWKTVHEVVQALEESTQKPADIILKPLVKHTVKSVHHPYVELYLDNIEIGKVEIECSAALDVEGLTLKIRNGEIVEIVSGTCQGILQLAFADEVLAQTKTERIALPGSVATVPGNVQLQGIHLSGGQLMGLSGAAAGQAFMLKDDLVIGRASDCSIHLVEREVSRQHARLRCASGRWYIQDMNSAGGTYVNGARVNAAPLNNGDHIRVGSTEFEFHG